MTSRPNGSREDPQAVLVDARRLAGGPVAPVIPIGVLARYDRSADRHPRPRSRTVTRSIA